MDTKKNGKYANLAKSQKQHADKQQRDILLANATVQKRTRIATVSRIDPPLGRQFAPSQQQPVQSAFNIMPIVNVNVNVNVDLNGSVD
jgi:hypothetical protein